MGLIYLEQYTMIQKILPIAALTFVNMLGFTILIPVLPFIIQQYDVNQVYYGILLSSYAAFQFFGAPLLGSLSDIYGRKPILIISQLGTLLSWVVFLIAYFIPESIHIMSTPLPIIIIALARVIDGITGGNNSVANAYMTDIIKPSERANAFGILGAAMGIAMIVGPAIGGYTASFSIGYLGTTLAAILISTVTLIIMIVGLSETHTPNYNMKNQPFQIFKQFNLISKINKYRQNHFIALILNMRVITLIAFSGYISIVVLFMIDRFGLNERELSIALLIVGSYFIINQAFMVKRFVTRFGDRKTLMISHVLMMIGIIAVALSPNLIIFLAVYYILNLGIALSISTFKALLSRGAKPENQGEIMGLDESLMAASTAIMPIIIVGIYTSLQAITFYILATVIAASLVLAWIKRDVFYSL